MEAWAEDATCSEAQGVLSTSSGTVCDGLVPQNFRRHRQTWRMDTTRYFVPLNPPSHSELGC
jgi:hypothetical protein